MTTYCGNAFDGLMEKIHRSQNAANSGPSNAPGHAELTSSTGTLISAQVPPSNTQVSNATPIMSQLDFRLALIFTQPVPDQKKAENVESLNPKSLKTNLK